MTKAHILIFIFGALFVGKTLHANESVRITSMNELHDYVCHQQISSNPWNVRHLYDSSKQELFIPYQLWTGARWKGEKNSKCEHPADSFFIVDDDSETIITGMHEWSNLMTNSKELYSQRGKWMVQKYSTLLVMIKVLVGFAIAVDRDTTNLGDASFPPSLAGNWVKKGIV